MTENVTAFLWSEKKSKVAWSCRKIANKSISNSIQKIQNYDRGWGGGSEGLQQNKRLIKGTFF